MLYLSITQIRNKKIQNVTKLDIHFLYFFLIKNVVYFNLEKLFLQTNLDLIYCNFHALLDTIECFKVNNAYILLVLKEPLHIQRQSKDFVINNAIVL
jgi:hypothetical protein